MYPLYLLLLSDCFILNVFSSSCFSPIHLKINICKFCILSLIEMHKIFVYSNQKGTDEESHSAFLSGRITECTSVTVTQDVH